MPESNFNSRLQNGDFPNSIIPFICISWHSSIIQAYPFPLYLVSLTLTFCPSKVDPDTETWLWVVYLGDDTRGTEEMGKVRQGKEEKPVNGLLVNSSAVDNWTSVPLRNDVEFLRIVLLIPTSVS